MRLLVTVWNDTVATAWHTATSAITNTATERCCAISQKPRVPNAIGLAKLISRVPNSSARVTSAATTASGPITPAGARASPSSVGVPA